MDSLNLTKVSEVMSAKERAKLVISMEDRGLELISDEEMRQFMHGEIEFKSIPKTAEIKEVIAGCPPEQRNDYNFLISLDQLIWKVGIYVEDDMQYLELISRDISPLLLAISMSPFYYEMVNKLETVPVKTKDGFKKLIGVAATLYHLTVIKIECDSGTDCMVLKLGDDKHIKTLVGYAKLATKTIQRVLNRLKLIETIEEKYFDGVKLIGRDLNDRFFSTGRVNNKINEIITKHNARLRGVEEDFSSHVPDGRGKYCLNQIEEILLPVDCKANQEQVEKELGFLVAEAKGR